MFHDNFRDTFIHRMNKIKKTTKEMKSLTFTAETLLQKEGPSLQIKEEEN